MRPLILITNDDGALHPGLRVAVEATRSLGDLVIAAPMSEQTAMGRSYPRDHSTGRIEKTTLQCSGGETYPLYSVSGSPAQVVSYAVLELCPRVPDLCIAGVNFGENLGSTLTGSGTVGAALEAESYGIPSLAISLQVIAGMSPDTTDWTWSTYFSSIFAKHALKNGVPQQAKILNINIPHGAQIDTPIRRTNQSHQPYFIFHKPVRSSLSMPTRLKAEAAFTRETLEENSDIKVVIIDREISVTLLSPVLSTDIEWKLPVT